ncbi:MAG: glycosyltransferase family 39 protein [Acidobacteria bacterium]|nr:glycosyltransferase family 39 protein [Acidobacteriota bacterium]
MVPTAGSSLLQRMRLVRDSRARLAAAAISGPILPSFLFLAFALLCLPYPGLQQDEVLFAWPLFRPAMCVFSVDVAGTRLPLMLMSYLGALKSWLYLPLLRLWAPSVYSLRLPAVVLAALTIFLLHRFVSRLHSRTAGSITAFLLATDSIYLLTSTFDWGPVVLQHLLLIGFLLSIQHFLSGRSGRFLFLAFVLAGAAFWDKAVVIWLTTGLSAAAIAVYPRVIRQHLTSRTVAIAALGFALGALPLLAYNASRSFSTVTSNSSWELRGPLAKYPALVQTLNGSAFFGSLVNQEWQAKPATPATPLEALFETADRVGFSSSYSALPLLVGGALLLLALPVCAPVRRYALFLMLAFAVAWWFMTSIRLAGGSPHHVALLWPLPQILVAIVLAQVASSGRTLRTPVLALAVLAVAVNTANCNRYVVGLMRYGATWQWTDATAQLPGLVQAEPPGRIGVDDWGIAAPLDVVTQGKLEMLDAAALGFGDGLMPKAEGPADVLHQVKDTLWLGWTPEFAVQPAAKQGLQAFAAAHGLGKTVRFVVRNRNGQAMLEGYRFEASAGARSTLEESGSKLHDDTEATLQYQGNWAHGRGFGQAQQGTLAYTDAMGASVQFEFEGSSVTLVYTKAFNRGLGRLLLDGKPVATLDYYDAAVRWQQQYRIDRLAPGKHTLALEALGRSNPKSSGTFIDLDALLVEPAPSPAGSLR